MTQILRTESHIEDIYEILESNSDILDFILISLYLCEFLELEAQIFCEKIYELLVCTFRHLFGVNTTHPYHLDPDTITHRQYRRSGIFIQKSFPIIYY